MTELEGQSRSQDRGLRGWLDLLATVMVILVAGVWLYRALVPGGGDFVCFPEIGENAGNCAYDCGYCGDDGESTGRIRREGRNVEADQLSLGASHRLTALQAPQQVP